MQRRSGRRPVRAGGSADGARRARHDKACALLESGVVGRRHFLLGSTDDNLAKLTSKIADLGHRENLVGHYSPPFGPMDDAEWRRIVDMVRDSRADVVWVVLGTPLQDFVSVRLAKETSASIVAVGAAYLLFA